MKTFNYLPYNKY